MADKIINLDLSPIRKKRIAINGDESRILELNTSDLNITNRLSEAYPKLTELAHQISTLVMPETEDDVADLKAAADAWKAIDDEMRNLMDYIFDSNVSEMCAPSGSMYDPINGKLRFEWLIDILSDLYERELQAEFNKVTKRIEKHTSKYVKK